MNRLKLIANLLKKSMKDDNMMTKIEHSSTVLTCIRTEKIRLVLAIIILI